MLSAKQRQEIRHRHSLGESERSIALSMGINRRTVHAYIQDDTRGLKVVKRPSRLSILHSANQSTLLKAYEAVQGNCVVLSRLLQDDPNTYGLPEGFQITDRSVRRFFAEHYSHLKTSSKPAYQAFHCSPGQQLQIDFTQAKFQFADDEEPSKIYLFEAVYRWSHKSFVMICPDMTQASWLMGIASCLVKYGIPQEILCDNDKSLVIQHRYGDKPKFHNDFEWLCKPLGIKPRACQPNRPQTKGSVERFGRYLKENGLAYLNHKRHLIKDVAALQFHLNQWQEMYADKRQFKGKTVQELFLEEQPLLIQNNDMSQYLDITSFQTISSSRAGIHAYGYRIALPAEHKNTPITVLIRHNGEYRVSTLNGLQLSIGRIPIENLQRFKRTDRAPEEIESYWDSDQMVTKGHDPLNELRKLF